MPDVTRIIEQKATESIYNDDWALIDRPTEGEDGGTRKILVSRLKELLCGDYIADEWVAGETYTNGAIVSHEGKLYYNKSGGTLVHTTFNSNSWLEVKIDELLEKVISSVGEKWRRVDTYHYDDLVVYGGRLYRCIKNASTQGTWVSNEWIEANAEYYFKKVREYIARYGFVPSGEAIPSPYNKGDLILYRAPGDTTNSLYMRLNDTEHGDPTWIPENWLKVENIGGALSKIYDDMEESSCDVQIKEQSIVDENNVADLTSLAAVGSASGAIATFDDGSDLPMPKLEVAIEPQQDLHGYDAPWVGGAGKNKLAMDISDIKSLNTAGTWNGNTYTVNGAEYKINIDTAGNITSINARSVASNPNGDLKIATTIPADSYILSSGFTETNGVNDTFLQKNGVTIARGNNSSPGPNFTITESSEVVLHIRLSRNDSSFICTPMIRLASVTDATYASYSNICPISGWDEVNVTRCGKNLVESTLANTTINNVGEINVSGGSTTFDMHIAKIIKGETYTIQSDESQNVNQKFVGGFFYNIPQLGSISYNNARLANTPATFTAPIDGYVAFKTSHNYAFAQIELGSTTTAYEPYNGQTYTIDLDGTRYGGTLDVVSGVLTVDRKIFDLGTATWAKDSQNRWFGLTNPSYYINDILPISSNDQVADLLCSNYKVTSRTLITSGDGICQNVNQSLLIADAYALANYNATQFKQYLSGVQICYKLATPLTIQLTPTAVKSLLGVNNIWADTGDILDAEYIRDMTTIINSLIARIEALEN